jgi:nitroimidazol reductase NimA-like FMN-containing flavoprotein (pyridoxamine 5'-phosphate oxidase superfamily)
MPLGCLPLGGSQVTNDELVGRAKAIVEANRYMTLATAGEAGRPWASPVWYATDDYRDFSWVSSPEALHSRNIAARPDIAMVIFDSQVAPGTAAAVYISAHAAELAGEELERALEVYSRHSQAQGLPEWTHDDVRAPSRHRLYRASALEHFVLTRGDERVAVRLD